VLEQELGALKALGQGLAHGLLDDARTGETDQCARLGDHHVADHGEARRHAAHGRIGQHRHEREPGIGQARERSAGLGHLHEREKPLLHARATARRHAHERDALLHAAVDSAHHALAHHRPHRTAEKAKFERANDCRHRENAALNDHQRVGLAGFGLRFLQPVGIAAAVLELERIERRDLGADLVAALGVEQHIDARAGSDAAMKAAFRTHPQILFELGAV
jgi:hypothetical protein